MTPVLLLRITVHGRILDFVAISPIVGSLRSTFVEEVPISDLRVDRTGAMVVLVLGERRNGRPVVSPEVRE